MLDVLLTIDTEIWPTEKSVLWSKQWNLSPEAASHAFDAYILGKTSNGDFGIPFQLELLNRFSCKAVFFVEPLSSRELGDSVLKETVGMIKSAKQDVELHLHPEWNEKGIHPLIPGHRGRSMREFSITEQTQLIKEGTKLLREAGADPICAFRAGGYRCNLDTLAALGRAGIPLDSSFNASIGWSGSPKFFDEGSPSHFSLDGVWELPVTVFRDRPRGLRPAQLNACTFSELSAMLNRAWREGYSYFVIVSHSFELLTSDKSAPDHWVVRRFERLLKFLDEHRKRFRTIGFREANKEMASKQPAPSNRQLLRSNLLRTGFRMLEQSARRIHPTRRHI